MMPRDYSRMHIFSSFLYAKLIQARTRPMFSHCSWGWYFTASHDFGLQNDHTLISGMWGGRGGY
jgi:hypothetical protein